MSIPLSIAVAPLVGSIEKRNQVSTLITRYAVWHQASDVGITLATCFLPGGGLIAMAGSMAIQAPLVYQPLARAIAKAYLVNALDAEVTAVVHDAAIDGAEWDIGIEFGVSFFQDIILELFQEMGIGAVMSAIPVVGSAVAAYFDARIAATLTWRVGLCSALYYENGCQWLGSRQQTYEKARMLVSGGLSSKTTDRFDFSSLGRRVQGLQDRQALLLIRYWEIAKNLTGLGPLEHVLSQKLNINPDLIEAVLLEVRRRRVADGRPSAVSVAQFIQCNFCGMQRPGGNEPCPHCQDSKWVKSSSVGPTFSTKVDEETQRTIVSLLRSARLSDNEIRTKLKNDLFLTPDQIRRVMAGS